MRALIALAVSVCIASGPVPAALAGNGAKPAAPERPAPHDPEHDAVREALAAFFIQVYANKWKEAAASCHSTTEAEQALGLAMATLLYGQFVCKLVTETRLGADVARQAFPDLITAQDVRAAKVEIRGNHARLTVSGGASFRLAKVGGTWKLSAPGMCVQEKESALVLASGYTQMAQAYTMSIRQIDEGKLVSAEDVAASFQKNLNLVGEQMRAKDAAGASAR